MSSKFLLSVAALPFVRGAIKAHEVTALPGWDGPLPSKHYSGYLPVGKSKDHASTLR